MAGSILIYGEAKTGKTLDACFAFRNSLVLLSEPGGLESVKAQFAHAGLPLPGEPGCGISYITLKNLQNPMGEIYGVLQDPVKMQGKSAIIIDTGTELADRIVSAVTASDPKNGFAPYQAVYNQIVNLIRVLLVNELWVIMICHEKPEWYESGSRFKGCALFPGSKLPIKIPGMFSTVIRAAKLDDGRRVYQCDPTNTKWLTGDRYHACLPEQDLDLRPILWRMVNPGKTMPEIKPKPIAEIK